MIPAGGAGSRRTLLAVFAHPDDETAVAPLLARYAAQGHAAHVACVTSGQLGEQAHAGVPAGEALGAAREAELAAACRALGAQPPRFLRFGDQGIGTSAAIRAVVARVRDVLEEVQPDVVLTWGPEGLTGHLDHILTSAAVTQAFQEQLAGEAELVGGPSSRKLYYMALPASRWRMASPPASRMSPVEDALITTEVDCREGLAAAREAIRCYRTQWTEAQMDGYYAVLDMLLDGRAFLRLALSSARGAAVFGPGRPREVDILVGLDGL